MREKERERERVEKFSFIDRGSDISVSVFIVFIISSKKISSLEIEISQQQKSDQNFDFE